MTTVKLTSDNLHPSVGVCMGAMRELSNQMFIGLIFPKEGMGNIRFMPLESANALLGMLREAVEDAMLHKAGFGSQDNSMVLRQTTSVRWRPVETELPATDETVLIALASNRPSQVCLGYYDLVDGWKTTNHFPLPTGEVAHWANVPLVPEFVFG